MATLNISMSVFASVPPPPHREIVLRVHGDGARFVVRELARAGLDAHLVCFYGSNNDKSTPGLMATCQSTKQVLLLAASSQGTPPSEVHIWTSDPQPETRCVADRIVQGVVAALARRSDVEIAKNDVELNCKR
jgi:hypothetical protein